MSELAQKNIELEKELREEEKGDELSLIHI